MNEKTKMISIYLFLFVILAVVSYLVEQYTGIDIQAMYIFTSLIIVHICVYVFRQNPTYKKWIVLLLGAYLVVAGAVTVYYRPLAALTNILKLIILFLIIYIIWQFISAKLFKKEQEELINIKRKL